MEKEIAAKLLDKAAQICVSKHAGQRDKMGCAYFQHPMRVAMRCKTDDEKIVALLHDTIEDTDVTEEYLYRQGFPQYIVDAVLSVTKQEGEIYGDFVARAKENPIGRWVKLHDLEDNLDVLRLNAVSDDMADRFTKYLAARQYLLREDDVLSEPEMPTQMNEQPKKGRSIAQKIASSDRAYKNRYIKSLIDSKKVNLNEFTISVKMENGSIINNKNAIDTFKEVINKIGYDKVNDLNFLIDEKYPLISKKRKSRYYSEATMGWFVLSNISNPKKAYYLNLIFDMLDLPFVAEVVPKPN